MFVVLGANSCKFTVLPKEITSMTEKATLSPYKFWTCGTPCMRHSMRTVLVLYLKASFAQHVTPKYIPKNIPILRWELAPWRLSNVFSVMVKFSGNRNENWDELSALILFGYVCFSFIMISSWSASFIVVSRLYHASYRQNHIMPTPD